MADRWLAAQPRMGPVIAGAQNAAQVDATGPARSWDLTDQDLAAVGGDEHEPPPSDHLHMALAVLPKSLGGAGEGVAA